MSAAIGHDTGLVQGAEGNVSLKDDGASKPSIETGMYAVLQHRGAVHVHFINVLSRAVLDHGAQELNGPLDDISMVLHALLPARRATDP